MKTPISYTNSLLSTARSCLTKFDLRYLQRLDLDVEGFSEALAVGTLWHQAHDVQAKGGDPYAHIAAKAPGELWAVKLARLFSAYHWFWASQPFSIIESEHTFKVERDGRAFEGQIDGVIELGGRRGLLERKTTSDGVDDESSYWTRLRMDTQTGLYALALSSERPDAMQQLPDFILYDVVRKPTIAPRSIPKAEAKRMQGELDKAGVAKYFGEDFGRSSVEFALNDGRETSELYGARLTSDISDRPGFYFARREVSRTTQDFQTLRGEVERQIQVIEHATELDLLHRNPDACSAFGQCDFFALCSNNRRPRAGEPAPPGYRIREALHPELVPETPTAQ